MGHAYQAVGWNPQKKKYDLVLLAGVLLYLATFIGVGATVHPSATAETHMIRAFGTAALLLLHVVLVTGPLCRLDKRFLPLLYNRRHMGVTMFVLAFAHGALATLQFHGFGDMNPIASIFLSNTTVDNVSQFPFQPLGLLALVILFFMAATSHDFWLSNLTAPIWKALHMLVYVAYALIVLHVVLGVLQSDTSPLLAGLLLVGVALVMGLHLVAGLREKGGDVERGRAGDAPVDIGPLADIPEDRAKIVTLSGERVAVFRHDGKVSAVSNACQHQNGPLGEGRVIDGCITCPWHGYQYEPDTGCSPPPFTEKVPTFAVSVVDGRVHVDPSPRPLDAPAGSTAVPDDTPSTIADDGDFYVGYLPASPPALAASTRRKAMSLLVVGVVVALVAVIGQRPFAPAYFEFGNLREFVGTVAEHPQPMLLVERPDGSASRYLLAGEFKWGAAEQVAGLDGRRVSLQGTLVYRDGKTLVEVVSGSVAPIDGPALQAGPIIDLGEQTLVGEIVDSKCFLGVMNPGHLKPHRACAVRCISGGVPPVLLVRDDSGAGTCLLLVGPGGRMVNHEVLEMIAEPVQITGTVTRRDDLLVLEADPQTYRRLDD